MSTTWVRIPVVFTAYPEAFVLCSPSPNQPEGSPGSGGAKQQDRFSVFGVPLSTGWETPSRGCEGYLEEV